MNLPKSYKRKIVEAEAAVKRARHSLPNVPINALPPEVLAHIFHLVLFQQPCPVTIFGLRNSHYQVLPTKYPDTFTHVCSRWRRIALDCHGLWSHIDIVLSCSLSRSFHDRAGIYVARAHPMPLDIHIIDPGNIRQAERSPVPANELFDLDSEYHDWVDWSNLMDDNNPKEFSFLTSSPQPWIRSLRLRVCYRYHRIHTRTLEHCLANSLPIGVSDLVIDVPGVSPDLTFIKGFQDPKEAFRTPNPNQLLLSDQQLESVWRPTTTLILKGRYPRWSSTAYHGLTELRLLGQQYITNLEIAEVLRSSPELRIFQCDFRIEVPPSLGTLSASVDLPELEILDLKDMEDTNVERFLRLLNPGPKPLRLSLHGAAVSVDNDFFARSNVQEMWATSNRVTFGKTSQSNRFWLPPRLRVLFMVDWNWMWEWGRVSKSDEAIVLLNLSKQVPSPAKLDTLYMVSCRYENLLQFKEIIAKYSPKRLVLWGCTIYNSGSALSIDLPLLESAFNHNLPQFCPVIECLQDTDPNPLSDWD